MRKHTSGGNGLAEMVKHDRDTPENEVGRDVRSPEGGAVQPSAVKFLEGAPCSL